MSDDPLLKMYETQAELDKMREEMKEIQKQNNELKNQSVVNDLIKSVNDFQKSISISFERIQENFHALSVRVSNNNEELSQIKDTLRKFSEVLDQHDKALSQHNEILTKQNGIIQTLENNIEKETVLMLGGDDGDNRLDSLLILENNRDKWKELNIKLPYAVYSHGAQFLNNNLYIFGGYNSNNKELNWTYKLSKSLQWEKMADMNQRRNYISNSSVILNNQIWVCGGYNPEDESLKSVEMYDPETNKWKYIKEMNECRWLAAAAVVNGKIFCSGGYNRGSLNSVECYDPSSDVWTRICNMPQDIDGHGAVEMNGNLIVIGGSRIEEYFNSVWALDTLDKNAVWIAKPSMSISRLYLSIAKIHDKVFVCGGELIHTAIDSVEIFDGEVWRNGPKMPTSRREAPAVVIPMEFAIYLK